MPREDSSQIDIFRLLEEREEEERERRREELLGPLGIEEFFEDGSIVIDKRTCQGVECRLCIPACPTKALFWKAGEIEVVEDLCVYCGACVLSCIVDDCIKVVRKRPDGKRERFSTPRGFVVLQHHINTEKRCRRTRDVFPSIEDYLERYSSKT